MPLVGSAQAPAISVIVPSYNSENTIVACLQALLKQDCAALF